MRLLLACLIVLVSTGAFAEERAGRVDLFGSYMYADNDSTDATLEGIKVGVDIDGTDFFGLGIGYNMNDYININAGWLYGDMDATLNLMGVSIRESVGMNMFNANIDYNIFRGSFTPFLTGGVGYLYSNDLDIEDWSYNLGAGIRWDIGKIFIKVAYKNYWLNLPDVDDFNLNAGSLDIGVSF